VESKSKTKERSPIDFHLDIGGYCRRRGRRRGGGRRGGGRRRRRRADKEGSPLIPSGATTRGRGGQQRVVGWGTTFCSVATLG
jgi:hypothetical protein